MSRDAPVWPRAATTLLWVRPPGRHREDPRRGRGGAGGGEGGGFGLRIEGLPLLKPPYGRITAINLDKGDMAWQIAHGETPDNIRNHPKLKGLNIPRTGQSGIIGTLVTKELVIAGEAWLSLPRHPDARGAMLRAYDKATGKDAGAVYMPAPASGSPMTYTLNGRQYIVVAISGGNYVRRVGRVPAYPNRCGEMKCLVLLMALSLSAGCSKLHG